MNRRFYIKITHGEGEPTQIAELSGSAVRIGRGRACEVWLPNPDLAEVQCLLRRRGNTWYVQPIGPAGFISIEGELIDHVRPLSMDVTMHVGGFLLVIYQEEGEQSLPWSPIVAVEKAHTIDHPVAGGEFRASTLCRTKSPTELDGRAVRIRNWQSRFELRERWLQARQERRKWQGLGKAAEEGLNSRASSARSLTSPLQAQLLKPDLPEKTQLVISNSPSPGHEMKCVSLTPPASENSDSEEKRDLDSQYAPDAAIESKPLSNPPVPSLLPPRSHSRQRAKAGEIVPRVKNYGSTMTSSGPEKDTTESTTALRILSGTTRRLKSPSVGPSGRHEESLTLPSSPCLDSEGVCGRLLDPETLSSFFDPTTAVPSWHQDEALSEKNPDQSPEPRSALRQSLPSAASPTSRRDSADFPDSASIFAAQGRRSVAQSENGALNRVHSASHPIPTQSVEPNFWTLPTYLVMPPVSVVAAGLIGIWLLLAVTWTKDNRLAGMAARAALRTERDKMVSLDPADRVETRWWKTTAVHLSLWSAAIERSSEASSRCDELRDALDSARRAAPLEATIRFARAQPVDREKIDLAAVVGLSRDITSLTLTGHMLKRLGKTDLALRAYRRSLELAVESDVATLDAPTFDEDPLIRRFKLPHEEIIGGVIRDMVGSGDWGFAEWSEALPSSAVVRLAAGRILRERASPDAAGAFGLAVAADVSTPVSRYPAAEHHAAQAEALVLIGKRQEGADRYRKALAMICEGEIRRRWSFALAEVLAPIGEASERVDLLQSAISDKPTDEVTRRALDAMQFAGLRRVGAAQMPRRSEGGL